MDRVTKGVRGIGQPFLLKLVRTLQETAMSAWLTRHWYALLLSVVAAAALDYSAGCVTGYEGHEPGDAVPHFPLDQNPFVDEFVNTLQE